MKVIASMACLPSRYVSMRQAIASLAGQVDAVYVSINGDDEPPPWLTDHPKVLTARLSRNEGARMKLWPNRPTAADEPFVRLLVDDDIEYPPDYAARMCEALDRHPRCLVGVHGAFIGWPVTSYYESLRIAHHFTRALDSDRHVHVLGTGTTAYRSDVFDMHVGEIAATPNSVDVAVACKARRLGLGMVAVARPRRWLRQIPQPEGGSIWESRGLAGRAGAEEQMLRAAGPWPEGGLRPS